MQVKTERGLLNIGGGQRPTIHVSLTPRTSSSHFVTGVLVGGALGFVVGSVATLLVGEKSLLFAQHVWNQITRTTSDGERVHFELLLQ